MVSHALLECVWLGAGYVQRGWFDASVACDALAGDRHDDIVVVGGVGGYSKGDTVQWCFPVGGLLATVDDYGPVFWVDDEVHDGEVVKFEVVVDICADHFEGGVGCAGEGDGEGVAGCAVAAVGG